MGRRRALHPAFNILAPLQKKRARSFSASSSPTSAAEDEGAENGLALSERHLFLAATAGATPLPPQNFVRHSLPKPMPKREPWRKFLVEQEASPEAPDLEQGYLLPGFCLSEANEEMGDYLFPGVARRTLADLRRGRWPVQEELDLHGLTRTEAHDILTGFMQDCRRRRLRCIRLIHGKGMSSPGGRSVLKIFSRRWLIYSGGVIAFCEAGPREGGSGALLVLLKTS